MIAKGWEVTWAVGYSSEASGLLAQLKRQGAVTSAGLFTAAFSKSRVCSHLQVLETVHISI